MKIIKVGIVFVCFVLMNAFLYLGWQKYKIEMVNALALHPRVYCQKCKQSFVLNAPHYNLFEVSKDQHRVIAVMCEDCWQGSSVEERINNAQSLNLNKESTIEGVMYGSMKVSPPQPSIIQIFFPSIKDGLL